MPLKFWWHSFSTAFYIFNRLPTSVLANLSPFETLFKQKPNYTFMEVFGCSCYPFLRPYNKHKLSYHNKCVFLGYCSLHKSYKCLNSSSSDHLYISSSIKFNEMNFHFIFDFSHNSNKPASLFHPYFFSIWCSLLNFLFSWCHYISTFFYCYYSLVLYPWQQFLK